MFEVCDRKWRGVGLIPESGFRLRSEYRDHDAERLFEVDDIETQESPICISGQILKGLKKPHDCPAFGRECTPQSPLGATMVSSEGACAAYYAYGRHLEVVDGSEEPTVLPSAGRNSSDEAVGPGATIAPELFGSCPLPRSQYDQIVLGHGSGGWLTAELIERLFVPAFGNDVLARLEDQATVRLGGENGVKAPRLAFTTDSFVVKPLFFPGGDIGKLAVHGTVNDLAVGGAEPLFLSAAFILEEGLALSDLKRIVASMRDACDEAGVSAGHGRHQGRGPGQGGSGLHHDLGHRPGTGGAKALDRVGPARRLHRGLGDDRRPRDRDHVGARGDRVRDSAGERHRPAHGPGPRHARGVSRDPRHARPDPRRGLERAERAGCRLAGRRPAG